MEETKAKACEELSKALEREVYYYPKERAFVWDEEDEEGNIETLYVNQYLPIGKYLLDKGRNRYDIDINFWLPPKAVMYLAKFYVEKEESEQGEQNEQRN